MWMYTRLPVDHLLPPNEGNTRDALVVLFTMICVFMRNHAMTENNVFHVSTCVARRLSGASSPYAQPQTA